MTNQKLSNSTAMAYCTRAFVKRAARRTTAVTAAFALASTTVVPAVAASTNSNKVDVTLSGSIAESIALVVAVPTAAFGVFTPGASNTAPLGIAITSTWLLTAGQTVKLYAYFDSAASAMTGTTLGDNIPTSAFTASMNSGAAQAFTQTSPFTASPTATTLYSVAITSANAITAARIDSLSLTANLSGISLHSDTYTGTMHLQAQAL